MDIAYVDDDPEPEAMSIDIDTDTAIRQERPNVDHRENRHRLTLESMRGLTWRRPVERNPMLHQEMSSYFKAMKR